MNLKLKLGCKDRVGIVADISATLAASRLNIVFMEVVRENDTAMVYIEVEGHLIQRTIDAVIAGLKAMENFKELQVIDSLPQEAREDRFKVVLDNISDGVLSIDSNGRVTTINKIAAQIYNCPADKMIGRDIREIDLPRYGILECLEGRNLKNVKQNLISGKARYQYISTCRPLKDASGKIAGAVEIAKDMQEVKRMAQTFSEPAQIDFSDIIGNNPIIKAAIAFAQKIAVTDSPVAIRGDSGTGKELFARAIHTAGKRPGSFVPVNCAALPDTLLESELFGYEAGAFTGGRKQGKAGLFETAEKGTVFLDEIADMSLASQAKLLRLIQEEAVRRIGATREIPINTRIITATNKNLEQLVEEKKFRKDLYYRVSVLPIHIPPLSQRIDDIPLLVEHFLFALSSKLGTTMPGITPNALAKLKKHHWPGNIRELKNVVERAGILCEGDVIDLENILFSHEMANQTPSLPEPGPLPCNSLKSRVADLEKQIIIDVLKTCKTVRKSAKALDISHPALLNKMKKYGIRKTVHIRG